MTQGRKEIGEAILIAALSAFVGGLVTWGFEESKKRVEAAREKKRKEQEHEQSDC